MKASSGCSIGNNCNPGAENEVFQLFQASINSKKRPRSQLGGCTDVSEFSMEISLLCVQLGRLFLLPAFLRASSMLTVHSGLVYARTLTGRLPSRRPCADQ